MIAVNIGKEIKTVLTKKGMTVSEFGRRINKSRENVYSIFRRKSIDTDLLAKIAHVLEYDFFQYYTPQNDELIRLREENQMLKDVLKSLKK